MVKTKRYSKDQLNDVCEALCQGKVIAFPTDTVYGLGVVFDDKDALERLKHAKIRPETKPIPMMVSSLDQIERVAEVSAPARKLIHAFMPGAFTIVLNRKKEVASYITNDLPTIAIRMPDDDFVLALMNTLNKPLLVSSANLSEHHSCSSSEDVMEQLNGRIDGIVEGTSGSSVASTIVSVVNDEVKVLRQGMIDEKKIADVLKEDK